MTCCSVRAAWPKNPAPPSIRGLKRASRLLGENSSTPVKSLLEQIADRIAGRAHDDGSVLLAVRIDTPNTVRNKLL
ncbi:hypothetical protein [Streptomyces sp. NPDC090056]|uniref:hypothetical protein n=1 Tax=Streptomyces sp. NPDC090056 TaxID=3365934 RepID=UPI00380BFB35